MPHPPQRSAVTLRTGIERTSRAHGIGQFGDDTLVDDCAVRSRRDPGGVQTRTGCRVGVVNRTDQRLRGAAQQVGLQVACDRQAACGRQHGTHPDLRAQRVGIAGGVDVTHQRRGVGAQLTRRLFEFGVAALDDARDLDVGCDLLVVHQRQLELAAFARLRAGVAGCALRLLVQRLHRAPDEVVALAVQHSQCIDRAARSQRRPIAPLLQHGVDDRGEGRLGQSQFLVDELRERGSMRHCVGDPAGAIIRRRRPNKTARKR